MRLLNVEFKARCADLSAVRTILAQHGATGPTVDRQIDTYFRIPNGRLKLRDGKVERALIYYERPDAAALKPSNVALYPLRADASLLHDLLTQALGVLTVVDKAREIWWLDGVKIHLDEVVGLGSFVEAEAISNHEAASEDELRGRCEDVRQLLGIEPTSMVSGSYSDLLLARSTVA